MEINRILLTINVRWWNAEAAYALNVARSLTENGKNVWLLVNPGSPVAEKAKKAGIPLVEHIYLDSNSLLAQYRNFKKLKSFIAKHQIQLVNSFKSNGSFLFPFLKKSFPNLTYIKTRGEARPPKKHFLNRYVYGAKGCDGVIAVGNGVKSWLEALDIPDQRIKTVYYGDSSVETVENCNPDMIRKDLGISPSSRVIALLGRTQRVKGHLILLKAMTLLKKTDAHLLFLVKDPEEFPEELEEINAFIKVQMLEDRVSVLGFQKNLGEILSIIDAGIIPSISSEVNCRVAVEFLSCSIPVVSFPTGTLPEVVKDGENGVVCIDYSPENLARKIEYLFDNAEQFSIFQKKALQSYQERFTLDRFYKETYQFYCECNNL